MSKASMARHRTPRGTALAPRQGGIVRQPAATSEPPNLLIPWQGSGRSQICSQGGHRSPVVVPIRDDNRHTGSLFYTAWALLRGCGLVGQIPKARMLRRRNVRFVLHDGVNATWDLSQCSGGVADCRRPAIGESGKAAGRSAHSRPGAVIGVRTDEGKATAGRLRATLCV